MKLLEPSQVKDLQQQETIAARKKAVAVNAILMSEEKRLNDLRTNKQKEIDRMQQDLDSARFKIMDEKRALMSEVESLEKRKRQAEASLEPMRQALLSKEQELHDREIKLNDHQTYLEDLQDKCELGTDKLACERDEFEKLVDVQTKKMAQESHKISTLKQLEIETLNTVRKMQAEVEKRAVLVGGREIEAKNLLADVAVKESWLKDQLALLQTEQAHLASQQQTLQAAFSEARRKNLL